MDMDDGVDTDDGTDSETSVDYVELYDVPATIGQAVEQQFASVVYSGEVV